jgi:serine/threonine protein kinase
VSSEQSSGASPVQLVGTVFDGKYSVLGEVARGGMGIVYRGVDQSLNRPVAIKVLFQRYNSDSESVERFRREARAMASLDHPNIVPVYAIGNEFGVHYFVMKFLTGWTVAERMKRNRLGLAEPFGVDEVRNILVQLCDGLEHAHRRGLIHRDIKPSNLMIAPDGHMSIMDLGIVKETEDDTLTKTGIVFGTPDYMAPEHAQGQAPSAATDLYSLGIVAYEMLAGEQPFRGGTPFSLVLKHIKEPPPPLVGRRDDLHQTFQDVIFQAIAKKPLDRFASAADMSRALMELDLETVVAPAEVAPPVRTSPGVNAQAPNSQPITPILDRASLPQNRPSIYPRSLTTGPVSVAMAEVAPVDSKRTGPSVVHGGSVNSAESSQRAGHYTYMVTSTRSGRRRQTKALKYALLVMTVAGLIGGFIAYFVNTT